MEEASLRFAQKIEVARSMSLDEQNNEIWQLAVAINSLRNELAHSLKSEKRQKKTKHLIDLYFRLVGDSEAVKKLKGETEEVILVTAVGFFLGFLAQFEAEVDRFKSIVKEMDRVFNPHRYKKA